MKDLRVSEQSRISTFWKADNKPIVYLSCAIGLILIFLLLYFLIYPLAGLTLILFLHLLGKIKIGAMTIRSLSFDTTGWETINATNEMIEWTDHDEDVLTLSLLPGLAELPEQDTWRKQCREFLEECGAGLVSAEAMPIGKISAVELICKAEKLPGYSYTGIMILAVRNLWTGNFGYRINVASQERGTTGVREATVTALLFQSGQMSIDDYKMMWFQDSYDPTYRGTILRSLSDDEKYDSYFPDHPLSKIRRTLSGIKSSMTIRGKRVLGN
jgi:hypothetical protein